MAVKRQVKKTFRNVAQGLGGQNRRASRQGKVVLNGACCHTPLIPSFGRQRHSEVEISLVYNDFPV